MAFDGVCRLLSPPPRLFLCHIFRLLAIPGSTVSGRRRLERARLVTPKGRTLLSEIRGCHGTYFSTGEPTYWPTDHHRVPDLLDFFVARGIAANQIRVEPVFELSSDHSPILATVGAHFLPVWSPPHSLQTILTGTHFVPILPLISTFTYGSSNEASWTTRRITLLPSFRTPLGTLLLPSDASGAGTRHLPPHP